MTNEQRDGAGSALSSEVCTHVEGLYVRGRVAVIDAEHWPRHVFRLACNTLDTGCGVWLRSGSTTIWAPFVLAEFHVTAMLSVRLLTARL